MDDSRSCGILVGGLSHVLATPSVHFHCPGAVWRRCVVQDSPSAQRCRGQGDVEVVERVDLLSLSPAVSQVSNGHIPMTARRIRAHGWDLLL